MRTQLYYTVEVRDRNGKLLKRLRRKSRSFVKQWNQIIHAQAGSGGGTIKDTGDTNRTVTNNAYGLNMNGAAGSIVKGIVVGTGITAVTINDYAMAAVCAEGSGANNLLHLANTFTTPTVVGSSCSFTTTRIANNNSGSTISVAEIGIYVAAGSGPWYFLGVRDVLASPIDVPDGGGITVIYTIKVSV